jgi:hypothetical protein
VHPYLVNEEEEIQNVSAQFIAEMIPSAQTLKMPSASTELFATKLAFFYEVFKFNKS